MQGEAQHRMRSVLAGERCKNREQRQDLLARRERFLLDIFHIIGVDVRSSSKAVSITSWTEDQWWLYPDAIRDEEKNNPKVSIYSSIRGTQAYYN